MQSLRHSIRDRLRAVECPSDVIGQIGGWATEGAGQCCGERYELKVCMKWMNLISTCFDHRQTSQLICVKGICSLAFNGS